jgi:hypothetical protein
VKTEYEFRNLENSDSEIEEVSSFLRSIFKRAPYLTPRYLKWQLVGNPEGPAIGSNAWHRGKLVAHIDSLPVRARVEGVEKKGVMLLNTAVDPAHWGNKLSRETAELLFRDAAAKGYDFCLGIGNRYSTKPLLTRFQMLKPLEAKIGLGLPSRASAPFEPSFARVWSDEAVRWRLANPERPYAVGREGETLSITAPTGVPFIRAQLYEGSALWDLADQGRPSSGPLRLWLGLDPGVNWRRSAYLDIPRRLRPSPLNLLYMDLAGGTDWRPDPERVVFRGLDFDPY